MDFTIRDLAVSGDLDQSAGKRIDLIQTGDSLQDNGGKLGNLNLRYISVTNGTLV